MSIQALTDQGLWAAPHHDDPVQASQPFMAVRACDSVLVHDHRPAVCIEKTWRGHEPSAVALVARTHAQADAALAVSFRRHSGGFTKGLLAGGGSSFGTVSGLMVFGLLIEFRLLCMRKGCWSR